jgi:prepilin-type N-terminal cleavage/methylation domain-containing protein
MRFYIQNQLQNFQQALKRSRSLFGSGFTLIELLVVIAVIGVMAGAIITVVNPAEQLARGRDASRKSAVNQLGKSVEAYIVDNNGSLPTQNATWMTTLQNGGELKQAIPAVTNTRACTNSPDGSRWGVSG